MIMDAHVPTMPILFGLNISMDFRSKFTRSSCPPKTKPVSSSAVVITRSPSSSRSLACLKQHPGGPCRITRSTSRSRSVYIAATIELGRGCMILISFFGFTYNQPRYWYVVRLKGQNHWIFYSLSKAFYTREYYIIFSGYDICYYHGTIKVFCMFRPIF